MEEKTESSAEATWDESGSYSTVGANIHSPSGSSQWKANIPAVTHEEDQGYYETYVDYYYCDCGATK